jgi:hypothetical protein
VFAGILLAGAALTRTVGLPVLVLVLAFGFIRRWGARRVVTFAAAAFLPVVAYAIAYDATNGRFTVQGESGIELYGRVQATLPCGDVRVPRIEKPLCVPRAFPPRTPALKQGVTYFTWDSRSPVWSSLRAPTTQQQARLAADYAKRLVRAHPARYLSSVVHFTALYFDPVDPTGPAVWPVATWTLHRQLHPAQTHLLLAADATDRVTPPRTLDGAAPQQLGGGMIPLVAYQSIGRVPGPLLALALLLGLLLPVVSRRVPEQVRWSVCLLAACGLAMVVVPAATVAVSYRYLVPVIATAWPAGVVAAGALHDARRRRTGRHAMTRVGRAPDPQPAGVG